MAFHNVEIDRDLGYGSTGGPEFLTEVVVMNSGREQRNIRWQEARGRWDLAYSIISQERLDRLIAFFRARHGRAHSFLFYDHADHLAAQQPLLDLGGGTYQLVKVYEAGDNQYTRYIRKPVPGTCVVYVGGVPDLDAVVDPLTGYVTGVSGSDIGWTGEFYCHVRFDTDRVSTRLEAYSNATHRGAYDLSGVPIVEILTP